MNHIHIYQISPDYKRLVVWSGRKETGQYSHKLTVTCSKGQRRRDRYDHLVGMLKHYDVTPPDYVPAKNER
jgi:hypothetical protein